MTTLQGIAVTTQVIRYVVDTAVHAVVPEAVTTLESPQRQAAAARDEPRVSVFLVQVVPDPLKRGDDLPLRTADGVLVTSPRVGVNLRYLLTFFGPAPAAQLMLGAVELALRGQPYLDPATVRDAVADHPSLRGSGLDAQRPPVMVAPLPWDLELFARMWSSLFQAPYTLATLYEATGLVLDAGLPVPDVRPVREVDVHAVAAP
ncbi:MAG: DUF4255 domain-containing protein [Frankiaceae bacterium]|nr:DUF4255 domain-containing protein [Frankiaceae bacterium]MBV9368432.1 DUF4255 domain-containing protein [Frankiales bacterium]